MTFLDFLNIKCACSSCQFCSISQVDFKTNEGGSQVGLKQLNLAKLDFSLNVDLVQEVISLEILPMLAYKMI